MPTVFEAAANNDVPALIQLIQQNPPVVNQRYGGQAAYARILANFIWHGKKILGIPHMVAAPFLIVGAIVFPPAAMPLGLGGVFSAGVGTAATFAGDGALAKHTYRQEQWTPLHFAAAANAIEAALLLINNDADVSLLDTKNRTFLMIAKELKNKEFSKACEAAIQARQHLSAQLNTQITQNQQLATQLQNSGNLLGQALLRNEQLVETVKQLTQKNIALQKERNELAQQLLATLPEEKTTLMPA